MSESSNFPTVMPSLLLDFANRKSLDPRITFTRASTATFTGPNGLVQTAAVGVPRFDYNPTTLVCNGLLIEEQRTNLLTYSEQFDNAVWVKTNSSITANAIVAPDGTTTADKLIEDTATSTHQAYENYIATSLVDYTFSVYAKAGERSVITLLYASAYSADFNLSAGTASGTGASIVDVGNGWYRCIITRTMPDFINRSYAIRLNNGSSVNYTGDGTSGAYIWGAQLEAGAFPTSYIPTVASSVTRSADAASMTGVNFSEWYKASEGTLYCELGSLLSTSTTQVPGFNMGDSNNRIELRPVGNAIGHARGVVQVGGLGQVDISITTLASIAARKVGMGYKINDFYITGNGLTSGASSSSGIIPVVSQAQIGTAPYDSNLKTNGTIKKIAYYPWRLTNAQLQALTS